MADVDWGEITRTLQALAQGRQGAVRQAPKAAPRLSGFSGALAPTFRPGLAASYQMPIGYGGYGAVGGHYTPNPWGSDYAVRGTLGYRW
jgi:hypothetical protein